MLVIWHALNLCVYFPYLTWFLSLSNDVQDMNNIIWVSNFIFFFSYSVKLLCDCDGNIYLFIAEQLAFTFCLLRQQCSMDIPKTISTNSAWKFLGMQILGLYHRLQEIKHWGVKPRNLYFKTSSSTLKCENHCLRGIQF